MPLIRSISGTGTKFKAVRATTSANAMTRKIAWIKLRLKSTASTRIISTTRQAATTPRLIRFARPVTAVLVPVIALGLVYAGPLRTADGQHHLAGVTDASFQRLGYAAQGAVDTGLLRDLDTSIRELAETGADRGSVVRLTNCYHNLLRRWAEV